MPPGTGKRRTEPHRASLRGCMPLKKIPKFIFFVLPLWTDARNLAPVSRTRGGFSFLPLCEGVAFRYSLLHYPVSGCPPELRPCRWGLGDKLTGCSFVSLRNLWSGHNSVPISRKKAAEQKSRLYTEIHTDTSTSPAEPPCISSGFFPKEQAERLKNEQNSFAGFHHAQSKPLKNGRVRPCGICSKDTADQIEDTARTL